MPLLPQAPLPAPMGMDNTSDAQVIGIDTAQYLQNALCDKAGLLRTNVRVVNLLSSDFATPIDAVGYYYVPPPGKDLVLFISNGILYTCEVTPGSPVPTLGAPTAVLSTPPNPFPVGVGARFVAFNDEMIILAADGSIQPMRFTIVKADAGSPPQITPLGQRLFQLGINPPPAPALAPTTGGSKLQTVPYTYYLTYFDEKFRESSLSLPASITLGAPNNAVIITCPAFPDPQARGCNVYESVPGSTAIYRIHTFGFADAGTTFTDILSDGDITAIGSIWLDPENVDAFNIPHKASVGVNYKNYLILNDVEFPQQLQVSNLSSPTQFSPIHLAGTEGSEFEIDTDQADPVMALVAFGSVLKIWKQRGFYIMFGDFVEDFTIRALHQRGTVCSDSAVRCDNAVLSYSLDGVYSYNYVGGFLAERTSQVIQASFDALAISTTGQSQIQGAHAAYVDNKYFLWIDKTCYLYDFRAPKPGWTTISLKG